MAELRIVVMAGEGVRGVGWAGGGVKKRELHDF